MQLIHIQLPMSSVTPAEWIASNMVAVCLQIGVIRLSAFNARAQQDVMQAINTLADQGATEFVLDVRDNRGGLVQEGVEVAKLFLDGKQALARCLLQSA